jgi:hypothetical protein
MVLGAGGLMFLVYRRQVGLGSWTLRQDRRSDWSYADAPPLYGDMLWGCDSDGPVSQISQNAHIVIPNRVSGRKAIFWAVFARSNN